MAAARSEIFVGTPKAHKHRSVPLPEFLLPYLARQCEGKGRDELLFPDDDGGHLKSPHPESGWFGKAVAASGVPRVPPHDLRHTAASLAVSAGANVKAVQRMLGHASAAMTLDIYADLFDDDLEAVATALDQARSRTVWPKCGHGWAKRGHSAVNRPSNNGRLDLLFYPTDSATATMAEVIRSISGAEQM